MPEDSSHQAVKSAGIFLLFSLLLFIFSPQAWCHDNRSNWPAFSQTVYNTFEFREVEWISRNHKIGTYRGGPLTLKSWVAVQENAFLGLDRQGRLVQVLQLPDRTIAFLLSGEIQIRDFFFRAPGELYAIDEAGELYSFEWSMWNKSRLPKLLANAVKISTGTMCVSWMVCLVSAYANGLPPHSFPVLLEMAGASVSVLMSQAFFMSHRFQIDNDVTSGLKPLHKSVSNFKASDYIYDSLGRIVDVRLRRRGEEPIELSSLIDSENSLTEQDFKQNCEHELLARGVPF